MKFVVQVWDCRDDTDDPCRTVDFDSWDKAIEYVKQLPAYEGGVIDRKLK